MLVNNGVANGGVGSYMDIVVPVSCTEAGRWNRATRKFMHSGHVMRHDIRSRHLSSVSCRLASGAGFSSDQGQVWSDIDAMEIESGHRSPSSAMRDTYLRHVAKIDDYLNDFSYDMHQSGCLVFINDEPAGCDVLSDPKVYRDVHATILRSYIVDAVLDTGGRGRRTRPPRKRSGKSGSAKECDVNDFLAAIAQCEDSSFDSVGCGRDYRFDGPDVVGSALEVDGTVVHANFLPRRDSERPNPGHSDPGRGGWGRDFFGRFGRRS